MSTHDGASASGPVLEKESRKNQARHELRQSVSLDPAFESARKDLKRLK